jgi:hypothetical protein
MPKSEFWTLLPALRWIQARTSGVAGSDLSGSAVQLHEALKIGRIQATGSVDGQPRRSISAAEWYDYCIVLQLFKFLNAYHPETHGTRIVEVISARVYPSGAVNLHHRPAGTNIQSAQVSGEPGFHRVIDDVLFSRAEIIAVWPEQGPLPSVSPARATRNRIRPVGGAVDAVLQELFPNGIVPDQTELRNKDLCFRVREKLRHTQYDHVSDDTILRAAGRRRR